jgi:SulP family sulfate permease
MTNAEAPRQRFLSEFRPMQWLLALASGVLIGGIVIFVSVSLAALIFTGPLAAHLPRGVEIALVSAMVIGLIVSVAGSGSFTIAIPQDRTAPILAIMAASIVSSAPAGADADWLLLSVLAAIIGTTLVTGVFLLSLGLARVGNLMRFIPYSVLGGFLAGTGWLLVIGAFRVMTGLDLVSFDEVVLLLDGQELGQWLPGLIVAVAIVVASRRLSLTIALPLLLFGGAAGFYLVMLNQGESMASLAEAGWLLGAPGASASDFSYSGSLQVLMDANWSAVPLQWEGILTVLVLGAVSIMLTASAMEMLSRSDMDVNRELRVAGIANLAAGLGGGMVGFHSLSLSGLALRMGGGSRLVGVVAALTCGAALWFGSDVLSYLPRVVLGGLLLFLGLTLLGRWGIATWGKLPHGEYLVIPLILGIIATLGFLEGILAGLLAATILFVINYSRTSIIRYVLSGKEARSRVARNPDDDARLLEHGEQLLVLKLRGHLFFGTATQLLDRVRERLNDPTRPALRYVLIDFRQLTGIDSSAMYSFRRLHMIAGQNGFKVLLTDLAPRFQDRLRMQELLRADEIFEAFVDMDRGLEWYENRVLAASGPASSRSSQSILHRLSAHLEDPSAVGGFLAYLSEIPFPKGYELIHQGETADDLYFLEKGEVSVYLQVSDEQVIRVQRMGAGTVVGELAFYLGTPRSASVVADGEGMAYRLTRESLERMEVEHPDFAVVLHRFIADLLAERLLRTLKTVEAVMD